MPPFVTLETAAAATACLTAGVVRRMRHEYERTDTLALATTALLYGTCAADIAVLLWAARRRIWPIPIARRPAQAAGLALLATGAAVSATGAARFGSAAQISGTEPGVLVTTGTYRYVRNPQYLGLIAAFAGIALSTRSGLATLIAAGAWVAFDRWIPDEERHLERAFGPPYRAYLTRTRRWLPVLGVKRGYPVNQPGQG